jgi:ABC-type uncharacterized transport system ATPase subunit
MDSLRRIIPYLIPIILLEIGLMVFALLDLRRRERVNDRWVDRIRTHDWIASASESGDLARIVVTDVDTAKQELLRLAVEDRLMLDRFELVRPSLEDVFLRLVGPGSTL